jgi:hypothetical protein
MARVYHHLRMVNQALSVANLTNAAPLAVANARFVGHLGGVLERAYLDFRITQRIITPGGTPPPAEWVSRVFPYVSLQFDAASTANTPADPNTSDSRLLGFRALRKQWRPGSTTSEAYAVDYWTDPIIETHSRHKGNGGGTNWATVTAFLWTGDTDAYWAGVFYDHREINWQAELSVVMSDTF